MVRKEALAEEEEALMVHPEEEVQEADLELPEVEGKEVTVAASEGMVD